MFRETESLHSLYRVISELRCKSSKRYGYDLDYDIEDKIINRHDAVILSHQSRTHTFNDGELLFDRGDFALKYIWLIYFYKK